MNANEFIKTISKIPYRPLTKEFKWAAQNKKILTPLLLKILKKSISGIKKIAHGDSGHIFAIYFLAQFREKSAFPLIITLLKKMKGSCNEDVFHDELEHMPNILASTFNSNIKLLYDLIEDKNAYEYARAAALETMIALWHTKQLPRKKVIAYFKKLFDMPIQSKSGDGIRWWLIYESVKLYPTELIQEIRLTFYFLGHYCDYDTHKAIGPAEFEKAMGKGKAYILKKYLHDQSYHFITNVKTEMSDWCWFRPEPDYMKKETKLPAPKIIEPVQLTSNDGKKDDSDGYYCLGDEKHMAYCHELFGKFNEKGLLSLQEKYDTHHLDRVSEYFDELSHQVNELRERIKLMEHVARELIDGDSPFRNNYDIEEHGDIGDFAYELHELATDIDLPDKIVKKIAPLCRLWNIDENNFDEPMEFYKDSNDVLDEPNGLEKENRSW